MLIKCPNCSVRYEIPEEIGLVEGRKLKCSECKHVFVYTQSVVDSVDAQPSIQDQVISLPEGDEPVLDHQENVQTAEVFLPEPAQDTPQDALAETFTPVASEENMPEKQGYRLPLIAWIGCFVCLFALACAGFYYADFISADYLLGMNNSHQTAMDIARRDIAAARRDKIKRIKNRAITDEQAVQNQDEGEELPASLNVPVVEEDVSALINEAKETVKEVTVPEVVEKAPVDKSVEIKQQEFVAVTVKDEKKTTNVDESILEMETETSAETPTIPEPVVMYKDKEIVREANGNVNVRMHGSVQNPSEHELVLPPVVHAVAFDENGRELFSKDIYLTDRYLDAGQTQDFFGSYSWHPQNQDAQIQWIDMSF